MAEHGHHVKRNSSNTDQDDDSSIRPAPDGGWGWMVVFGSFMIHIINDGVTYSFGVFYDDFLTYFNEGKAKTAWILSILVGVTLCSGPISSSFVNKYGCRTVTLAGTFLASGCLIVSYWANSVTVLCITIGLGTGLGFGLIYLPAIVSVTMYFDKKRSLATGIAVCGSGLGTFVFAPLINILLEEYGWRGAMVILGGIVLECLIFGALFRPLEYEKKKKPKSIDNGIPLKKSQKELDLHISDPSLRKIILESNKPNIHRPRSMGHFTDSQKVKFEQNGNISNGKLKNDAQYRLASSQPLLTQSDSGRKFLFRGPLYKPDIFYQKSLGNLSTTMSRMSLRSIEAEKIAASLIEPPKSKICGITCSRETKDTLREMLDFSLFKDVLFIIFTISNFLTSVGFNMPYVYIVSRAKSLGIDQSHASFLLSVIGIANTIGRIILGYISDKPWVNRLWVYNVCLTVCGVSTALSAFATNFYTLSIYASIFGFTIGAYVGLTSVLLVDFLGLERLTNAFGLVLLFQGIASLIGPPLGGALYDNTQSYDPAFYLAGVCIAISGLILFAVPPIQRHLEAKRKAETVSSI
ncbi:monocarboxylate transporter 5 [Onthophagus taurus]|uniref:monocarboxylate transporter 5 n=1 Tax=Onthophagus taurus TaxID=166361 RepID=UPI0039BE36B4